MRLQLALDVSDIDEAVEFYSKLFDAQPYKRKPGYANFAIENPPLKLVLFENAANAGNFYTFGDTKAFAHYTAGEAVPEPSAAMLFALGSLVVGRSRRQA